MKSTLKDIQMYQYGLEMKWRQKEIQNQYGLLMKLKQKEILMHQYLKISFWLQKRYTKNGVLTTNIGLTPTKYTVLENLAWSRFMEQSI